VRRRQVGTIVGHREKFGEGVALSDVAEPAANGRFDHEIDVRINYQLQLDLGHLQCELQGHAGEDWKVQTVESVRVDHRVSEGFEHVGEKEHVELEIEMVPIAQRGHATLRPQLLRALILFVVELFANKAIVEGRLRRQLVLVQLHLVRHVLVRIAALLEVGVVIVAEMSDGVREPVNARLSQRFSRGGRERW